MRRAYSWFLGARQPTGMSDCHENRGPGTPSPDPCRLMKAPSRAILSPKGERASFSFSWQVVSRWIIRSSLGMPGHFQSSHSCLLADVHPETMKELVRRSDGARASCPPCHSAVRYPLRKRARCPRSNFSEQCRMLPSARTHERDAVVACSILAASLYISPAYAVYWGNMVRSWLFLK